MGDQLSCTYQLMGRQKVDKKKYIKPTQSLPNIISRTQNTDTHTQRTMRVKHSILATCVMGAFLCGRYRQIVQN